MLLGSPWLLGGQKTPVATDRLSPHSLFSLPFALTHIIRSFISIHLHDTPPASHCLPHMHLFCLSGPTPAHFSHERVLPQEFHLLRCTPLQAPSHLQSQAGAPTLLAGGSPYTRVMGSLFPGLALAHRHTWLRNKLAAGSASADKLPSPKL